MGYGNVAADLVLAGQLLVLACAYLLPGLPTGSIPLKEMGALAILVYMVFSALHLLAI